MTMSAGVDEDPDLSGALACLEESPHDTVVLERLASLLGERVGDISPGSPGGSSDAREVSDAGHAVRLLLDSARIHHDKADDQSTRLALALARLFASDASAALVAVAKRASEFDQANEVVEVLHILSRDHENDFIAIRAVARLIDVDHIQEAITAFRSIVERTPHMVDTWVDLVRAFNRARQPNDALQALEDSLIKNPGDSMLFALQAEVLYALDQEARAIEAAEAAVADPSRDPDAASLALEVLLLTGRRDRVRELLDTCLETSPENARLHIVEGDLLTDIGDYEGALEQYDRAKQDASLIETADVAASQALRKSGHLSEAANRLGQWTGSHGASTLLERASLALARGKPGETERILAPVVDQNPSGDQALRLLSIALRAERNFTSCAVLLERKFIGRAAAVAATERGYLAFDQGLYHNAEAAFRKLLGDRTDPVEAIAGLSETLRAQGRLQAARELVQRALHVHPGNTWLCQQLGWVAYDEHRYEEAAAVFGSLVTQNPYDSVSRRMQANSLRFALRLDEARQLLDGAPRGQDDPGLNVEQGWIAYEESDYGEAKSKFRQVLDGGTDPIEAIRGLAAVLRAQGRPAEAAKQVKEALADYPSDPSLHRELGWVAYTQRRYKAAVIIFRDLVHEDKFSILDRQWLAVSLRMDKRYREAQKVLKAAPQQDNPILDLQCGWVAYDQFAYDKAVQHFRAAGEKGASAVEYVPPLVSALLRLGDFDAAEQATAINSTAPALVIARSEILMERGRPQEAIEVLMQHGQALNEAALLRLVKLLQASYRDNDAQNVLNRWLSSKTSSKKDPSRWASPDLLAVKIELASRDEQLARNVRIRKIQKTLKRYSEEDQVPAVIVATAIRVMRVLDLQCSSRLAMQNAAREPADIDVLMEIAETAFERRDYNAALAGFEQVLELDDRHDRAAQWRCRALRRLGDWKELHDYLAVRTKKLPRSSRLHVELGWLCFSRGDYQTALQNFINSTRADPNSGQALFGWVNALRELQRWNEAERVLEVWKSRWPASRRRELAEAILRIDQGKFGLAYNLFKARKDLPGLLGMATVSVRRGETPEARRMLEQAIKDYPDRPGPKIALALLLCESGSDQERDSAETHYATAMGYGAEIDAAALAGRAYLALNQKRLRAAESLFKEAIQCNPNGQYAAGIAATLIQEQRPEAAVDLLEERVRTNPGDSASYCQLYLAHSTLGHRDQAISALRLALTASPDDDSVAVALAYAIEEAGRQAEAEQILRQRLLGQPRDTQNQLRLGLAWILLARGDRTNTPALIEDAAKQATLVLQDGSNPDARGAEPATIQEGAIACRGTAYLKLAERERNPRERIRFAELARKDQKQGPPGWQGKPSTGTRLLMRLAFGLDATMRLLVFLTSVALLVALGVLHETDATRWNTTMVVSLTPLLLGVAVLAALLPSLQTLRLAGLQAQTREPLVEVLPASAPVTLPQITEFTAAAIESLVDFVNVDELYSGASPPRPTTETASSRNPLAASTAIRTSSDLSSRPTI